MTDYLLHHNANTHWHFPTSLETDQLLDEARRALADFLNAAPSEIAFGDNMTTLTFHVGARAGARAGGRATRSSSPSSTTTPTSRPGRPLARERGVTLRRGAMRRRDAGSSTGTTSSAP